MPWPLCWLLVLSIFNHNVLSLEFFLSSNLQYGNTALHDACSTGHDSVVKLLIDAHADLGIANEVSITKPMAIMTARIPMQHIEALCNACTDGYASYGNNSLPSSFSLTTFPPPPLSSPACYAHSDNSGSTTGGSSMTLKMNVGACCTYTVLHISKVKNRRQLGHIMKSASCYSFSEQWQSPYQLALYIVHSLRFFYLARTLNSWLHLATGDPALCNPNATWCKIGLVIKGVVGRHRTVCFQVILNTFRAFWMESLLSACPLKHPVRQFHNMLTSRLSATTQ